MKTIETRVMVKEAGTVTVPLPPGVSPGEHDVLVVIDEGEAKPKRKDFDFPVISVGKWPEDLSLRREDMYNDDGR